MSKIPLRVLVGWGAALLLVLLIQATPIWLTLGVVVFYLLVCYPGATCQDQLVNPTALTKKIRRALGHNLDGKRVIAAVKEHKDKFLERKAAPAFHELKRDRLTCPQCLGDAEEVRRCKGRGEEGDLVFNTTSYRFNHAACAYTDDHLHAVCKVCGHEWVCKPYDAKSKSRKKAS